MNANGNLTVDSDVSDVEYMILSEALVWEGEDIYRPRSLAGFWTNAEDAQRAADERNHTETIRNSGPVWQTRVVKRETRKVVTFTEA